MGKKDQSMAADLGLLVLRATAGGLLAGHGAQKLFGSFGGHGIEGTAGMMEKLGMQPAKPWAVMAGASEFGSGLLMALGLLGPVGPISAYGPMVTAWTQVHAGKPIWVTSGGAELPLTYLSVATTLALTGPGRFSLDRVLGIKVPPLLVGLTAVGVLAGLVAGHLRQGAPAQQEDVGTHTQPPAQAVQSSGSTENEPATDADSIAAQGIDSTPPEEMREREVGND
jgi:putative oxidoreductase